MHAFCANILVQKITKLCFGFKIFCRQNIGAKAAHQMLMKLTPWVDFTNIFARLFCQNKMRSFLWQMEFGKCRTVLANNLLVWQPAQQILAHKLSMMMWRMLSKLLVKLNGKFLAESCAPATFLLGKQSLEKSTT